MKIISYNVNGIRAAMGKNLISWLQHENPDVLCIQETKAQPEQIPLMEFQALGYHCYCHSAVKKGYSGVALFSKIEPKHVEYGMNMEIYDREGRFLRADFDQRSVVSVYHPSGTGGDERQNFKMQWLNDFQNYVTRLRETIPNLVICGDYNICHKPIDIHDPVGNAKNSGFLPEEREWIGNFIDSGFIDSFRLFHPEPDKYSWWSYRFRSRERNKGWRIDYCMVSEPLRHNIADAGIMDYAIHSDHCPVWVEIK